MFIFDYEQASTELYSREMLPFRLLSQVSETEMNGQFESVCESVFSEVESQAMEALDLPGCFRTRSHSYLRAIQAGYSQDDDCIPPMGSTVTSTIRATTGKSIFTFAQVKSVTSRMLFILTN